jgi:hypothetical protein
MRPELNESVRPHLYARICHFREYRPHGVPVPDGPEARAHPDGRREAIYRQVVEYPNPWPGKCVHVTAVVNQFVPHYMSLCA